MNVIEVLKAAPEKMALLETTVSQWRKELDTAKKNLEVARALAIVKNQEAKNQKVLDAIVELDDDVKKAHNLVIAADANYRVSLIEFNKWDRMFISARRLSNLQITVEEIGEDSTSPQ